MSQRRLNHARNVPCLRKDGSIVYVDITATRIAYHGQPCLLAFFHDVTEQRQAIEAIRAGEERHRLIADNVADVIWTVEFPPSAVQRALTERERGGGGRCHPRPIAVLLCQPSRRASVSDTRPRRLQRVSLRDVLTPDSFARPRGDDCGV